MKYAWMNSDQGLTLMALAAGLCLTAGPVEASELSASATAGSCGDSIGCSVTQTSNGTVPFVSASEVDDRFSNTANADAQAGYGLLRVDAAAQAFSATFSTAGANADASATDIIPGYLNNGQTMTVNASLDGLMTNTGNYDPGWGLRDSIDYRIVVTDLTTGARLVSLEFALSDPAGTEEVVIPPTPMSFSFVAPVGDALSIYSDLSAGVQTHPIAKDYLNHIVYNPAVGVNFFNTAGFYIQSPAGSPDLIGLSGYDYSHSPFGAAPEPSSWAEFVLGLALFGGMARARRRRGVTR